MLCVAAKQGKFLGSGLDGAIDHICGDLGQVILVINRRAVFLEEFQHGLTVYPDTDILEAFNTLMVNEIFF